MTGMSPGGTDRRRGMVLDPATEAAASGRAMSPSARPWIRRPAFQVAAALGALWGGVAYAVLWGETAIMVTVRYVQSPLGLVTLLPARLVLYGIRFVERQVSGRPFSFSDHHGWIGLLAALVGAAVGVVTVGLALGVRRVLRRLR